MIFFFSVVQFLEEEKRKHLKEREDNFSALMAAEGASLIPNPEEYDCSICFLPVPVGEGVILRGCLHEFCK